MNTLQFILTALGAYLAIGLLFALAFVCFGVSKVDHAAKNSPLGFRLLILPGSMLFWPLLARRWINGTHAAPWPRENTDSINSLRRFHARLWLVLGPALLLALIALIALRPGVPR